jgi:hypothetical protein
MVLLWSTRDGPNASAPHHIGIRTGVDAVARLNRIRLVDRHNIRGDSHAIKRSEE